MSTYSFSLNSEDIGKRLDIILKKYKNDVSRSSIIKLIKSEKVKVNKIIIKDPSFIIKELVSLSITIEEKKKKDLLNYKLDIIFEDDHLIILNKQAGILTHCSDFNTNISLVDLLNNQDKKLEFNKKTKRAGVVHRLDKDTSGVIVFAKTLQAGSKLSQSFRDRKIKKIYHAISWGIPAPLCGTIDLPISSISNKKKVNFSNEGKIAFTDYKVIKKYANYFSLIECNLLTGRTHQLRVHLLSIGCPILGDHLYSKGRNMPSKISNKVSINIKNLKRQALHAKEIEFEHPITNNILNFKAQKPKELKNLENLLFEKV